MEQKSKLNLLEEMFEMESDTLSSEVYLESIDNWDSMTKLSLIVLFDEEFKKKLTGEQIRKFIKIQDVLDYMD